MSTLQKLEIHNQLDDHDIPTGGYVKGIGISINWQNGPIGRDGDKKVQNGAFVEDVLEACLNRLKYYQDTKFNCPENVLAISGIEEAIQWLKKRTEDREHRLVEGTHDV